MKGGNAHPRLARERDYVVGTGIVHMDAIKHAADLAEMTVRGGERPQVMSSRWVNAQRLEASGGMFL